MLKHSYNVAPPSISPPKVIDLKYISFIKLSIL